jgi:hypothetical protein
MLPFPAKAGIVATVKTAGPDGRKAGEIMPQSQAKAAVRPVRQAPRNDKAPAKARSGPADRHKATAARPSARRARGGNPQGGRSRDAVIGGAKVLIISCFPARLAGGFASGCACVRKCAQRGPSRCRQNGEGNTPGASL